MKKLLSILALAALFAGAPVLTFSAFAQDECAEGEVYNPETSQCEVAEQPEEPQCEEGQVYNPETSQCEAPQE